MWADMNAATPPGARGRSAFVLHVHVQLGTINEAATTQMSITYDFPPEDLAALSAGDSIAFTQHIRDRFPNWEEGCAIHSAACANGHVD